MNQIEKAISEGKIEGYNEKPEVVISDLSHVYLFKNTGKAFKIYKRNNPSFNNKILNINSGEIRKNFIKEDFKLNHKINPDIYLHLHEAVFEGDQVVLRVPRNSDELVIEMTLFDATQTLNNILYSDQEISSEEFFSIGEQFGKIMTQLCEPVHTNKNWYDLFREEAKLHRSWFEEYTYFETDTNEKILEYIANSIENAREDFEKIDQTKLVQRIDSHGLNTLYIDKKLAMFDVMLPKPEWRMCPPEYQPFYLASDILVFRGKEAYEQFMSGVQSTFAFNRTHEDLYITYSVALILCIQHALTKNNLTRKEILDRYKDFLEKRCAERRN